jgi:sRNA-binding protein
MRHVLCGAWRLDLDGKPAGTVTRAEEAQAKGALAGIEARRAQRLELAGTAAAAAAA